MNLRAWVAAPLAGAVFALVSPSPCVAAQASAPHAYTSLRLQEDDDDDGPHGPWRPCHSPRGVVLIDKTLRAILTNGRRGPEATVLQGDTGSASSPVAPWTTFSVSTYLNVNYPTQTTSQYEFRIRAFYRVHPLFEVKAFDNHRRLFPFPAAHCDSGKDDAERGNGAPPHGGATPNGRGSSGSPLPGAGALSPVPRDSTAAGWSTGLLSAKNIAIGVGTLLVLLGTLATAWLRRRRSSAD
ncbi:hypothetical protein [Streptomyces sp. NPDC046759]|uniref:hypothetical protein n=1 Tax=Streptomyces sp. NPDC046759 TaxID=3155019 RepID=UPI0033E584B4